MLVLFRRFKVNAKISHKKTHEPSRETARRRSCTSRARRRSRALATRPAVVVRLSVERVTRAFWARGDRLPAASFWNRSGRSQSVRDVLALRGQRLPHPRATGGSSGAYVGYSRPWWPPHHDHAAAPHRHRRRRARTSRRPAWEERKRRSREQQLASSLSPKP